MSSSADASAVVLADAQDMPKLDDSMLTGISSVTPDSTQNNPATISPVNELITGAITPGFTDYIAQRLQEHVNKTMEAPQEGGISTDHNHGPAQISSVAE